LLKKNATLNVVLNIGFKGLILSEWYIFCIIHLI
jgi:hypothetical protein